MIQLQKQKLKAEERKKDTRRKIILGGLVEKHCALNPDSAFARQVQKLIGQYVDREQDRALFGLAPKPETQKQDNENEQATNQDLENKRRQNPER